MTIRVALVAVLAAASFAQSSDSPAFEAASLKPNRSGRNGSSLGRSGGRLIFDNVSLRECIAFAYGIPAGRDFELIGPAWLDTEKFDIAATFSPEASRDRIREMMQTLLAERFHLSAHGESRQLKAYALVAAKKGPKLKAASSGEDAFLFGEGRVTVRAFSISAFADRLSGPVFKLEQPVVDMTGIKGVYDFTLEWAPDGVSPDGRSGPSIFTALQEQLGLKLEVRQITAAILVVDHADRVPTGN